MRPWEGQRGPWRPAHHGPGQARERQRTNLHTEAPNSLGSLRTGSAVDQGRQSNTRSHRSHCSPARHAHTQTHTRRHIVCMKLSICQQAGVRCHGAALTGDPKPRRRLAWELSHGMPRLTRWKSWWRRVAPSSSQGGFGLSVRQVTYTTVGARDGSPRPSMSLFSFVMSCTLSETNRYYLVEQFGDQKGDYGVSPPRSIDPWG